MEYGLLFTDRDFNQRKKMPNMDNLPAKCCATCDHWIECTKTTYTGKEESKCYGVCPEHSDDEWDAFSWADDLCERYVPIEEDTNGI